MTLEPFGYECRNSKAEDWSKITYKVLKKLILGSQIPYAIIVEILSIGKVFVLIDGLEIRAIRYD